MGPVFQLKAVPLRKEIHHYMSKYMSESPREFQGPN